MKKSLLPLLVGSLATACSCSDTNGMGDGGTSRGFGSIRLGTSPQRSDIIAQFANPPFPDSPLTTLFPPSKSAGACKTWQNQGLASGGLDGGIPPPAFAGTINIMTGANLWTLTVCGYGMYCPPSLPPQLWNGGDTIRITASGMNVPAFSTTLTAPGPAQLTTPSAPTSALVINRSSDLLLRWTGGQGGSVGVYLGPSSCSINNCTLIECYFPASDAMGTIPSSVLMDLAPGPGGLGASTRSVQMLSAGNYDLLVDARHGMTGSDSLPVSYKTTIQ